MKTIDTMNDIEAITSLNKPAAFRLLIILRISLKKPSILSLSLVCVVVWAMHGPNLRFNDERIRAYSFCLDQEVQRYSIRDRRASGSKFLQI